MLVINGKDFGGRCWIVSSSFIIRGKKSLIRAILLAALQVPDTTLAAESLTVNTDAKPPGCLDAPAPDPVSQYDTLPVHARIAEYLAGYDRPNHLSCQSENFRYEATRNGKKISVISRYKKNLGSHAEYVAVKDEKISGRYRKHGVFTAFWPNGKKQLEEYYVNGFAVGFHSYFDETEALTYVADFSASDYERDKRIGVGDLRTFHQGSARWGNPGRVSKATQLFRNVYAIENGHAVRKAFATAELYGPSWIALDLTSMVSQWTSPGKQGKVTIDDRVYDVVNSDMDYLPFFDVYLGYKLSLQGPREPKPYNQDLLESPWIDQAMRLGLEDERFKFKRVASTSPEERALVPQNRYTLCRAQPTVDCLFEQVTENLKFASHRDTYHNGFGLAALAACYPEWAQKTMKAFISETNSNGNPYTWLAEPMSILARAEWALGLNTEAKRSTTQAFDIAFTERGGSSSSTYLSAMESVLPLFSVADGPVSADKAIAYLRFAETEQVPNAWRILEHAGIAQARHGNILEAMRLADALPSASDSTAATLAGLRAFRDKQLKRHTPIMLALAEGRLDRGDVVSAREALDELEVGEPYFLQDSDLAVRAGILYARLGEADRAVGAIKKFNWYIPLGTEDIAVNLCKANKIPAGQDLARKMAEFEKSGKSKELSVGTKAKLAKVEFFCGNPEKAKTDLAQAFSDVYRYRYRCASDFCDIDGLINGMKLAILDTGWLDIIWQRDLSDDASVNLKIAVKRAEQGDAQAALARLDDLAVHEPRGMNKGYPLAYALAKAQILARLGRDSEVDRELARARNIAVRYDDNRSRAGGLLALAKALLKFDQKEKATKYAEQAFKELMTNLPNGSVQFTQNSAVNEGIVKLLAETGADADAMETAWSLLEPDRQRQKLAQMQARQKILAEIALTQFQQQQQRTVLEAISNVDSLSFRLDAWLRALAIAEKMQSGEGQEFVRSALSNELEHLQDSLNTGMKPTDRRLAIHSIATLLRSETLAVDEGQKLKTIQLLADIARAMTENQYGTKALCELAYTAHSILQPSLASAWFEEAGNRAPKYYSRTFAIDESPLGACAYWSKSAGNTELANRILAELFKSLPENLDRISHQIHTLLNIAIADAEYEKGEIFWAKYGR